MTEMEFGSRSDLEALRRSGRGKFVALGVLLAAALGGAAWSFLDRGGIGNPEDPAKVLVVSRGTTIGYSAVLSDGGFEAAEGTLSGWENKARDEIEDLEHEGVAAVLHLADMFGYGYVAFEAPQEVDFSGVDIEGGVPTFDEHVEWAVLSVGDFAHPHVLTVNPEPSKVLRDKAIPLLQALFAQERLVQVLPENEAPSVEVIQLRDRLGEALHKLSRLPEAEKMAEKIVVQIRQSLEEEERAEPKPRRLAEPLESGIPLPLADGGVLSITRVVEVVTRDAVKVDLDLQEEEVFSFGPADASPDARRSCAALLGGKVSTHDAPRFSFAVDGSSLLVQTLSEGLTLWRAGADGGCAFERVGEVPAPRPGMDTVNPALYGDQVARSGHAQGYGVVSIVRAGGGEEQLLAMLDGTNLGAPVWIDAEHLAVVGRSYDGPESVHLLSTAEPMKVLRLEATVFENAYDLGQVAAVPGGKSLVVSAGSFPRKLYRVDLPQDLRNLFATPVVAEEWVPVERPGAPTIYDLDPSRVEVTVLTREGRALDPTVSPDGTWVAFTLADAELDRPDASGDTEIAVVRLSDGSGMRLVTRNALPDHSPFFVRDGKHLVFQTRVEIPKTNWHITAPRVVAIEE